jgi:hypothetical protein
MLAVLGLVLMALGLLSGGVLVVAGLGLASLTPGLALWVTFPLLCLLGYALFVVGASLERIQVLSSTASVLLLVLAVVSLVALVLQSATLIHSVVQAAALWYVAIVGGFLGVVGMASGRLQRPAAAP